MEAVFRQQGDSAEDHRGAFREREAEAGFSAGFRYRQSRFTALPVTVRQFEPRLRVCLVARWIGQPGCERNGAIGFGDNGQLIADVRFEEEPALTDAGKLSLYGILDGLGVGLVAPPHAVWLEVGHIGIAVVAEKGACADAKPLGGDACARAGPAGELAVAQQLRAQAARDAGAGMLQVMAKQERR